MTVEPHWCPPHSRCWLKASLRTSMLCRGCVAARVLLLLLLLLPTRCAAHEDPDVGIAGGIYFGKTYPDPPPGLPGPHNFQWFNVQQKLAMLEMAATGSFSVKQCDTVGFLFTEFFLSSEGA